MADPRLRFGVFGGVRVVRDDADVPIGPPQQRALLGLLLVAAGRPVGLGEIIDTLWGSDPSSSAVNLVHRYVGALRRVLEPDLPIRATGRFLYRIGDAYRIGVEEADLDLGVFRERSAQARADRSPAAARRWLDALTVAQGELAAGVPALSGQPRIVAIQGEVLAVAAEAAESALRHGAAAALVPAVQAIAGRHPLDEPVHAALIRLLTAAGRHAEALGVYGAVRNRLAQQLGISPSPILRGAYRAVLDAEKAGHRDDTEPTTAVALGGDGAADKVNSADNIPNTSSAHSTDDFADTAETSEPASTPAATPASPPAPAPHHGPVPRPAQLPLLARALIGRASAEEAVVASLRTEESPDAAVPLTVISGMAGVGKTCLAISCAHQVAGDFPDGQLYVNLRGFDPAGMAVTPREALAGFLEALGVPAAALPDDIDARTGRFRSLLAGRRLLVVLDNACDTEQLEPLLPSAPGCAALITSRNQLSGLITRYGARPVTLRPLSPEQAREALARRLGRDRVEADPEAADRIVAACAGLPLALAVVAARAAHHDFPLSVTADQLERAASTLHAFTTDGDTVDVRAAFSWSYEALPPGVATLFRQLAAHPGPEISVPATVSMTGRSEHEVRRGLAALRAASLLEEPAAERYALHDLLRAFAAELCSPDEQRSAFERLAWHFTHSARAAYDVFGRPPIGVLPPLAEGILPEAPPDVPAAMEWYERERIVLRRVVDMAEGYGLDAVVAHLTLDWRPMALSVDTVRDLEPYTRAGLAAAGRLGSDPVEAEAQRSLGAVLARRGEFGLAESSLREALRLFESVDDAVGQSNTLRSLGQLYYDREAFQDAAAFMERAAATARRSADLPTLTVALSDLLPVLAALFRFDELLAVGAEAQATGQEAGVSYQDPIILGYVAFAQHGLGRFDQAVASLREALAIARAHRDLAYEVAILGEYGDAMWDAGDVEGARAVWKQYWTLIAGDDELAGTAITPLQRETESLRRRFADLDPVTSPAPTFYEEYFRSHATDSS